MPTYAYQAVDSTGKRRRGEAAAVSAGALSQSLEERGMLVLEVAEARAGGGGKAGPFRFGRRREVLEFTRAMAALLPVGMPLAQALNASLGVATADVRDAILEIKSRVERGEQLSVSLATYPKLFSPLYVGLIRAGEKSGDLDSAFGRLATQLERDEKLRATILSAAIYPALLAFAGSVAIAVLLLFVLPQFVDLLKGSGAKLPRTTEALLAFSSFLRHYWPIMAVIPIGLFGLSWWMKNNESGRRAFSRMLLAIPLVKTLRQYALAARFARLLGVLIGGGAPLLTALDDTIESLTDPQARDDVIRIRTGVREGSSLRVMVSESLVFPPLLAQLIGVGEEAGQLREFLTKSAELFEERTERTAQRVADLAAPAMIVIFGGIVAFVALSLLQAIYGINAGSFNK